MRGLGLSVAAWLATALPAAAQFGVPGGGAFGSPGIFGAPEAASGAIGAGAASGAANQQQCMASVGIGRDGSRSVCTPNRPPSPPPPKH